MPCFKGRPPVLFSLALGLSLFTSGCMLGVKRPDDAPAAPQPAVVAKPQVLWYPSPNHDPRPWWTAIDMIVVHDTQSPGVVDARQIARYFANPKSGVSAHYVIGKDGLIVQCVPDGLKAWHAGLSTYQGRERLNECSIGIELVNAETGRDPFTEAQYRALSELAAYLVSTYHIPTDRIVGHKDITANRRIPKTDPAPNFDWARFMTDVRVALGETTMQAEKDRPASRM